MFISTTMSSYKSTETRYSSDPAFVSVADHAAKGVQDGIPNAMKQLGEAYHFGWGRPKNLLLAAEWYFRALDAGVEDKPAIISLALDTMKYVYEADCSVERSLKGKYVKEAMKRIAYELQETGENDYVATKWRFYSDLVSDDGDTFAIPGKTKHINQEKVEYLDELVEAYHAMNYRLTFKPNPKYNEKSTTSPFGFPETYYIGFSDMSAHRYVIRHLEGDDFSEGTDRIVAQYHSMKELLLDGWVPD